MSTLHKLIEVEGLFEVERRATSKSERRVIRLAARSLGDERSEPAYTHPGLCLTILPHRARPPKEVWERTGLQASLKVVPLPLANGSYKGVPFGPKARLILLYLQSEAIKTQSRFVELGSSMRQWLMSMGISVCGTNYQAIADQAERIEHSLLIFDFQGPDGGSRWQDSIIRGAFRPREGDRVVELSEGYFAALQKHPVPLSEHAIRELGNTCLALDLYLWLAYRLHALQRAILVPWRSLHLQFGAATRELKHFKPRLVRDLELALAVYPKAQVELTDDGLRLWPSDPPLAASRRPRAVANSQTLAPASPEIGPLFNYRRSYP